MANNVTRMPNRSPGANTTMTTRSGIKTFGTNPSSSTKGLLNTLESARKPANTNKSKAALDALRQRNNVGKYGKITTGPNKGYTINSGKYAYGPKAPSAGSIAGKVAGTVARGVMRAAGPVGALVGMATPVGVGSDKPKAPLMAGNAKSKGPGGGVLSAPARTAPSRPGKALGVPGGYGITAYGYTGYKGPKVAGGKVDRGTISGPTVAGGKGDLKSTGRPPGTFGGSSKAPATSSGRGNTSGVGGGGGGGGGSTGTRGSSTTPSKAQPSRTSGPSRGPTSAPARTAPSKANLGTSRF